MFFRILLMTMILLPAAGAALAGEAAVSEPIALWPKGAPGPKADLPPEADTTKDDGKLVAGKRLIRLGNVSNPTITIYSPAPEKKTGAAVVVCPGGGYNILAMDLEGTEVCEWLNSIGVTGVLLKYRVPASKTGERYAAPLQDAQRALGIARSRASEWGIDPGRIGIMGFSAGGHLSAAASNIYEKRTYDPVDAADEASCRPDFTMLIYPAYLAAKEPGLGLSPELKVTEKTPPTLLVQSEDDSVRVECSINYYMALKNAKVPAEMHLYAQGGHGYGLRETELEITRWPQRAESWLKGMGLLEKK